MRNEKLVISILMQFLYSDKCIDLSLILLRNVILQCCFSDVTIKIFCFVNAHFTASYIGELANQITAYKIIVLE